MKITQAVTTIGMLLLSSRGFVSAIPQPKDLVERQLCYRYAFESKHDFSRGPASNCCCAGQSCTVSWGYSQTFILSGEALDNADGVAASYEPYPMVVVNLGRWVPTLLYTTDSGATYKPVPVSRFSAYYNLGETPAEVAIPQNLKMLAGDSSATTASASPSDAKVEWFCEGDSAKALDANGFPSSTCSTHLQTLLYFPQCVNTATLETAYKSKSYGTTNYCPKGYNSMSQLRFSIRYDLRKSLPNGWSGTAPLKLACGNAFCSHGDFINGWTEEAATNMIATTADKRVFSAVNGALGKSGDKMSCTATDADPNQGTSDYAKSVAALGKRDVPAVGWESRTRFARSG